MELAAIGTAVMAADDSSPGPGGSRRPGNLWTVQAREDMFRRREAGEGWETICQDYPNRSRHAMQQQYSMMKKQRAMENGTWKVNSRGRKRKLPTPEQGVSDGKNGYPEAIDDDLTEADDLSEGSPDGAEVVNRLPPFSEIAGRPGSLSRAITDPVARSQRAKATPNGTVYPVGQLPNPIAAQPPAIRIQGAQYDHDPTYQMKRRKASDDKIGRPDFVVPLPSPTERHPIDISGTKLNFPESELLALMQRGRDQTQRLLNQFEEEKQALRQHFDAAITRANRRAHEAQGKISFNMQRHEGTMLAKERELRDKIRESAEEKEAMRRQAQDDMRHVEDIQVKNIEALRRENEILRRSMEAQRRQTEDSQRVLEQKIARMKLERQQSETPVSSKEEMEKAAPPSPQASVKQPSEELASPTTRARSASPGKVLSREEALAKLAESVDTVSASIKKLNSGLDTTPFNQLLGDIGRLAMDNDDMVRNKDVALRAFTTEPHTEEDLSHEAGNTSPVITESGKASAAAHDA